MKQLAKVWAMSRSKKKISKSFYRYFSYYFVVFFSFFGSGLVEIGTVVDANTVNTLIATVIVTLFAFVRLGLYRAILRYLTFHALTTVMIGALISAVSVSVFSYYLNAAVPRTVPIIYPDFFSFKCWWCQSYCSVFNFSFNSPGGVEPVLIYGAGSTGRQLAIALRQADSYRVRGFIDDDHSLEKTIIQGLTVYSPAQIDQLVEKLEIKKVLLAFQEQAVLSVRLLLIVFFICL